MPPHLGADRRRQSVHPDGFEALPGYMPAASMEPARRAISELTYGPSPLRLQTGPLTGMQAAVPDTTLYPWRVSSALRITLPDGRELFGTGWFIGPRAIITAAHAVYPREPHGYVGWA